MKMNTGVKAILFIAILISTSMGQVTFEKGFVGGLHSASMAGEDLLGTHGVGEVPTERILGFSGGIFLNFRFKENTISGIQVELLYSTKGVEIDGSTESINYVSGYEMNYLDIPIIILFSPHPRFNLYTGPSVGIFLTGENYYDLSYTTSDETESWNGPLPWKQVNSPDVSIVAGGNYDLTKNVSIHLRYVKGLQSIVTDSEKEILHDGIILLLSRRF